MINEEAMKHWADEFNEIQEAKDARIEELEKQLAERDAALARCVEVLKAAEGAIMDEVCASSGEDHPVINAHAKIAKKARKVLASLGGTAKSRKPSNC